MAGRCSPGFVGIDGRFASALMACLAAVTLIAGIAASTRAAAGLLLAQPEPFITDDLAHHAAPAGRSAHRLCRSPIRLLGTAAGRKDRGSKRDAA